ncbi:MAG: hypothetical protein IJR07_08390 [Bacteroidaceae bacterium]|nr:hypothetical protein [Bacteroidaceae bacterium]
MRTTDERDAMMAQMLRQLGELIEQFRLDTHTTFEILTDDTSLHYHTYRKVATGDPKQRTAYTLLAIAEMMRRDDTPHHELTDRFFCRLRALLYEG